ncbi:isochorismatase family protein [Undibacter mobilis]|uniref:Isochorismatase family protein n=1 Tax=Undibacter mobilis TaxID=2292256 RepID=A0A371B388_9BRAD|nr:isochorismatase family protein [Undibacter mobilis]RDV02056.1 isochorismatase family protein [Undibacter mobilis]
MDDFEDHCWQDVYSADVLELYRPYRRPLYVGPRPAVLLIDLYQLAYAGGPKPISDVSKMFPSSCGIAAWNALPPTQKLLAAARRAQLPIFYTTGCVPKSKGAMAATQRGGRRPDESDFVIQPDVAPEEGDVIITKERASAFFGTLLATNLTRLGIQSLIVAGETTSGCVRASVVDAYSSGFHVTVVEECCFDRSELSHKVNLFDMHHKYADVLKIEAVLAHLAKA